MEKDIKENTMPACLLWKESVIFQCEAVQKLCEAQYVALDWGLQSGFEGTPRIPWGGLHEFPYQISSSSSHYN